MLKCVVASYFLPVAIAPEYCVPGTRRNLQIKNAKLGFSLEANIKMSKKYFLQSLSMKTALPVRSKLRVKTI